MLFVFQCDLVLDNIGAPVARVARLDPRRLDLVEVHLVDFEPSCDDFLFRDDQNHLAAVARNGGGDLRGKITVLVGGKAVGAETAVKIGIARGVGSEAALEVGAQIQINLRLINGREVVVKDAHGSRVDELAGGDLHGFGDAVRLAVFVGDGEGEAVLAFAVIDMADKGVGGGDGRGSVSEIIGVTRDFSRTLDGVAAQIDILAAKHNGGRHVQHRLGIAVVFDRDRGGIRGGCVVELVIRDDTVLEIGVLSDFLVIKAEPSGGAHVHPLDVLEAAVLGDLTHDAEALQIV